MNKNHYKSLWLYVLLILFAAGTYVIGGFSGHMRMNYLFLLLMAALILYADLKGLRRMREFGEDAARLTQAVLSGKDRQSLAEMIRQQDADYTEEEKRFRNTVYLNLMETGGFKNPRIQEDWLRLIRDWRAEDGENIRIEDYLDEDEVLEHCSGSFCRQVPGILTALGILGTFIGLIVGLHGFDFAGADQMTSSVGTLVGGLNVAFFTSVYGVALSIVFNLVRGEAMAALSSDLNALEDLFDMVLHPIHREDTQDLIRAALERQEASLAAIKTQVDSGIGKNLGSQIGKTLKPQFDEINESLRNVVFDFRNEQSTALTKIVTSFVKQMRGSLDSHINELGLSVDALSLAQTEMTGSLKGLLEEIARTGTDTANINEKAGQIMEKVDICTGSMQQTVDKSEDLIREMSLYADGLQSSVERQEAMLAMMSQHEARLDEICTKILASQEALNESILAFQTAAGQRAAAIPESFAGETAEAQDAGTRQAAPEGPTERELLAGILEILKTQADTQAELSRRLASLEARQSRSLGQRIAGLFGRH